MKPIKIITVFLFIVLSFLKTNAQNNPFEKSEAYLALEQSLAKELYNCKDKAISDDVFAKNINIIKKDVIFNSTDDVTNNNSVNFTRGETDSKLSVGVNLNSNDNHFFNVSIFTGASEGGMFYSNDSWQDNTGAIITYNKSISKATQYYNEKKCEELNSKRDEFKASVLKDFSLMEKKLDAFNEKIKELEDANLRIKESKAITFEQNEILKENNKVLKELKEAVKNHEQILEKTEAIKSLDSFTVKMINKFDEENNILKGYKLHWFKTSINISNQNIKVDSISVLNTIEEVKNLPKLSADFSYNFNRSKNKTLLNYQGFVNITMGNFLDAILNDGTPFLIEEDETIFVYDDSNNQIGRYQDIKRTFWTSSIGMQSTYFLNNYFGFSGSFSHSFALQDLDHVNYKNRYSAQAGLVFKVQGEDDKSKAMFRILGGFEELAYNTKTWENTSVKVSAGIPFNWFVKK